MLLHHLRIIQTFLVFVQLLKQPNNGKGLKGFIEKTISNKKYPRTNSQLINTNLLALLRMVIGDTQF